MAGAIDAAQRRMVDHLAIVEMQYAPDCTIVLGHCPALGTATGARSFAGTQYEDSLRYPLGH